MIPITNITGRLGNQMFEFAFCYNYARMHGIDHYFQDPMFFDEYAEEIKHIYRENIPSQTNMVAIHVRRGDYVNNKFYTDLTQNGYYERAMEQFPDSEFIVFSDDIEWCKEQKMFNNCEFYHGSEVDDMNVMASCIGHIIANSSFSWWAAYISPYTLKVIAPSSANWYTDGIERTVCPENWVRL